MNRDITVDFSYDVASGKTTLSDSTTAKRSAVADVLEAYLRTQMGKGRDDQKAIEREVYTISISLDLDGDRVSVRHDCGNECLCVGIVLQALQSFDES